MILRIVYTTVSACDDITMVRYPDGNDIRYSYNEAGKVIERIDQRGIVTSYSYDGNGETTDN